MKVSTVLDKFKEEYLSKEGQVNIDEFIVKLQDACNLAIVKERITLVKKIGKMFQMEPEEVEKKILPKQKRSIAEGRRIQMETANKDQPILFEHLVADNGKEYYYQKKQYGLIIEYLNETVYIIVGYYKDGKPVIIG